jgi:thioredoxin 1
LSEDPEIAKIMQKKMEEMLKPKPEPKIEPGIIDLNDSNFDQTISAENPTLVDFWAEWCGLQYNQFLHLSCSSQDKL